MKGCLSVKLKKEREMMGNRPGYLKDISYSTALNLGYKVDEVNNVFVLNDFGAFIINVKFKINSFEDLKRVDKNQYKELLDLLNGGYEIVVGPAFPTMDGRLMDEHSGLYCKNYLEILEKSPYQQL